MKWLSLRVHTDSDAYRCRWWITIAIILVSVLEVLDMTIVTVALPDMMGSLQANIDQISWVLTSYSVSMAVMLPLTGLCVARLGCRRLLLINVLGFMVSSFLCGSAANLESIIVFRIAQGLFGASMVPLSQIIIYWVFPRDQTGLAIALWGIGILCAPIFGPVLGGYITAHLSWRWIFFLNIPVCLLTSVLILLLVRETPLERKPIDWWGLSLMIVGISALQLFLDRGNSVNWYDSAVMAWLTGIYVLALCAFVWRCWRTPYPIIHLQVFKNRDFVISFLLITVFSLLILGPLAQVALFLEVLFHYPETTAGLLIMPRGIGCVLAMVIAGPLVQRVPSRVMVFCGLALAIVSTYALSLMSLQFNVVHYIAVSAVQGVGIGLFFLPLATFSLATLPDVDTAEGAGLIGFGRGLGMAMGVSLATLCLTRGEQVHWHALASHVDLFNPNVQARLHAMDPATVWMAMATELHRQADVLAFNQVGLLAVMGLLILIPLVWGLGERFGEK